MKKGFTLVELLVVVGMIALLTGAVGNSVNDARKRARVAKAHAEVKEMTNAILAYENYAKSAGEDMPTMEQEEAARSKLAFILGETSLPGMDGNVPVLFNGNVGSDGKIRDPWGRPYRVTIREGNASLNFKSASSNMQTGYFLPNFYRLSVEERE